MPGLLLVATGFVGSSLVAAQRQTTARPPVLTAAVAQRTAVEFLDALAARSIDAAAAKWEPFQSDLKAKQSALPSALWPKAQSDLLEVYRTNPSRTQDLNNVARLVRFPLKKESLETRMQPDFETFLNSQGGPAFATFVTLQYSNPAFAPRLNAHDLMAATTVVVYTSPATGLVYGAREVKGTAVPRPNVGIRITGVWIPRQSFGVFVSVVGGTPPLKTELACGTLGTQSFTIDRQQYDAVGSFSDSPSFVFQGFGDEPTGTQVAFVAQSHPSAKVKSALCTVAVEDAGGQRDAVSLAVDGTTKDATFVRSPWFETGDWPWASAGSWIGGPHLSIFGSATVHLDDSTARIVGSSSASPAGAAPNAATTPAGAAASASWATGYPISSGQGTTTSANVVNDMLGRIEVFLDGSPVPIPLRGSELHRMQLEIGSTHVLRAVVSGKTFEAKFTVPRTMRRIGVNQNGIVIPPEAIAR